MSSRSRKLIIFLLLISTMAVFAYVKREIFFQQAKKIIKQNLEKNFPPAQLSIGKIRAGLFYGLVLENLEINFPQISGLIFDIKVDQAFIDYNFWEAIFSDRKEDIQQLRLISPTIRLSYPRGKQTNFTPSPVSRGMSPNFAPSEFALVLEDGRISFAKSSSGAQRLDKPSSCAQGLDKPNFPIKNLQGRILLRKEGLYFQDFTASVNDNSPNTLKVYGELSEERLSFTASLEHVKIANFDILTNFSFTLDKRRNLQDETDKFYGTLKTYGSVLNNRPFPELNSSFEIQDEKLRLLTFSLGDNYDLRGIVSLSAPFNVDLSLNFYQAAPSELISQFGSLEKANFAGLLNGLIKVTGAIDRPKIEGYLEVRDGYLGDLSFISADINIKGQYPRIFLVDSRILREEDSFLLEGEIDFTDLEKQNFLDISVEPDKAIFWQGWDITRSRENQVHMSKSIADDVKVTFDTSIGEGSRSYGSNYANELGLEYKIFGDKLLKLRLRKDEGILGLERRFSF